jgi:acyl transferase domain-containing protein
MIGGVALHNFNWQWHKTWLPETVGNRGELIMKNDDLLKDDNLDIAIIGMAGRFPGAKNVAEYWDNLSSGVESISFFSDEELLASGVDPAALTAPNYVKAAPLLNDVDLFDASFFGYSPKEAQFMDPQQRLFLECAWEALEHAGYDAEKYKGTIGIYAGSALNTYLLFSGLIPNLTTDYLLTLTGNDKDFLTTRVSYKLNLTGPSVTVQTACSTSLVAVHIACQSLQIGECDMAMAGGVSVRVPQKAGYFYENGSILTPDGHCRAFDAKAKGTIFGSGLGIVVLKRLGDAIADGDCIHAIIKGSAINNDGSAKVNYTAPSLERQSEVILEALANAAVDPGMISYVETHGTGTIIGDPIEIAALTKAYRTFTQEKGYCAIGSVKPNIGHLDAAAGVAGLIKATLALEHKMIPPSLHFEEPNPEIDFANSPFYVITELSPWEEGPNPRLAAVNGLGGGGTNAHIILEEAPAFESSEKPGASHLLLISSKTSSALETATSNLVQYLEQNPQVNFADLAYTLQVGRKHFDHRRMVVCRDRSEAMSLLNSEPASTLSQKPLSREIVFMFSGQGAQYVNMGLDLYKTEPVFKERIDQCSEILRPHLSFDLRDVLYPCEKDVEQASRELNQTRTTQPALFTIEYALAELWLSWGVHPQAFIGHSIGEYVAACMAGVFSLEDCLALVAARGKLMQELPGGSMLAIPLSEKQLQPILNKRLSLAAINSPSLCVVSGETEAIEDLRKNLSRLNLNCNYLRTSHAFHSAVMDPILSEFAARVKQFRPKAPRIPFISNVTGRWITSDEAADPAYWASHLRQTVRFAEGVHSLLQGADRVMLEVGPGLTLSTLVMQCSGKTPNQMVLPSLGSPNDTQSEMASLLKTLGSLWLSGVEIDWLAFNAKERRHRLPLPTYPFQRQRYWAQSQEIPSLASGKLPEYADHNQQINTLATQQSNRSSSQESLSQTRLDKESLTVSATHPAEEEAVKPPAVRIAPCTPVEAVVAGVWQEVLGTPQVGIHDNFFALGGHSVLATKIISRLSKAFQIELPLLSLYESPTVAGLAECVETVYRIAKVSMEPLNSTPMKINL